MDNYGLYTRWTRTNSEPPKPSWDVQRSDIDGGGTHEATMELEPYFRRDEVHLHGRIYMKEQSKGVQIVLEKIDPMENIRDRNIKGYRYSRNGRNHLIRSVSSWDRGIPCCVGFLANSSPMYRFQSENDIQYQPNICQMKCIYLECSDAN